MTFATDAETAVRIEDERRAAVEREEAIRRTRQLASEISQVRGRWLQVFGHYDLNISRVALPRGEVFEVEVEGARFRTPVHPSGSYTLAGFVFLTPSGQWRQVANMADVGRLLRDGERVQERTGR